MINFKVGILGAGHIAGVVADTLVKLDSFEPYAVASRDAEKAREFGEKYGCTKCYGSYEELANDPDVELIYIATPHSHHAEQALMCMKAGKPVLVEKAFSYNAESAHEVLQYSEDNKIFCQEAMWIRFLPMYKKLRQIINDGVIGQIVYMDLTLGYDLRGKDRIANPALGGGVLLDLGVYPLNIITMMTDAAPDQTGSSCAKLSTGMDVQDVMQIHLTNGSTASIYVTAVYKPENRGIIFGTKGYIEVDNINNPEKFSIYGADRHLLGEALPPENQISGYEYEFLAARNAIITGNIQCAEIVHGETYRIMKTMDKIRETWGVKFPME